MKHLFRRFFDELPCWASVQDRSLRVVAANRAFRRDFGETRERHCFELVKHRSTKCETCPVEQTFADGQTHSSEEIVRPNSHERNVIVYTSPLRDANGEIEAVLEVFTDITEVKQLQRKYQTLFEEVPCFITVQDSRLKIVEANHRFQERFGVAAGARCWEIYKHRTEPCEICPVAETFQDGQPHESEEVVTPLDGVARNVLVRSAPIRDAAGNVTHVMEMSTNITRVRQLQSQLASLGLIVGTVSHGIKGLLSGLQGGVYLLESGMQKQKPDRLEQGLSMLRRNIAAIGRVVLNILYYAKDRDVQWDSVDIETLVGQLAEGLQSRADSANVRVRVAARPGTLDADPHALEALLVNLVENGIDACRRDKKEVVHEVSLTAELEGDEAVFVVKDNGMGMDQETKEKAFSLFFSSKGAEGTGLGLFIANKIATAHGGSLAIDSTVGEGTSLTLRLRKKRPPAPEPEAPPAAASSEPAGAPG